MKKIALIGASGFIGSALLSEALERGYSVTAIVRHPERITVGHPNLEVVHGDVMSAETVEKLTRGADVVVSAYNPGWTNPNIATDTTYTYRSIVEGVKRAGVPRLLIVGGAGSLYVEPDKRLMDTGYFPDNYLPAVEALAEVLYTLQREEHELDWVFFSPARTIEPGEKVGVYRLGKDDLIVHETGTSSISLEDYSVAMMNEVETPQHHRERFTIGY